MDTIFAPATAPAKSGVAIIRISGPEALACLSALGIIENLPPRICHYATFSHPDTGAAIDNGLAVTFKAPASFTGEDVVELHTHGSMVVIHEILSVLSKLPGYRHADAGEFSRRAFENEKMDLTQAEAISDLIDAETTMQKQIAFRQMQGELGSIYSSWRSSLVTLLAKIEAYIDFPDEDLPESLQHDINAEVHTLIDSITNHLNDNRAGERLRQGLYCVILGAPNVGKSSLLNHLAKRDVAIVSHIAGTTRDVIEVQLDIGGYPFTLVDTAGIRESNEAIESEGIRRAMERAESADCKIVLFDATHLSDIPEDSINFIDDTTIIAINKCDIASPKEEVIIRGKAALPLSLANQSGLEQLINALESMAETMLSPCRHPVITRTRHRILVEECLNHLSLFSLDRPLELAGEDLRLAANALGGITGHIDIEEVLDEVFSRFCIGK